MDKTPLHFLDSLKMMFWDQKRGTKNMDSLDFQFCFSMFNQVNLQMMDL